MASIGKLALQLTADASGLVKGLGAAKTAMLSTNAKMLVEASKLGKMLDGANLVKGMNKLPDEVRKQVKTTIGTIKAQYPAMAKEIERQGKTLAKVMKDGSVGVAFLGKDGSVRYRAMEGLTGGMFASANARAKGLEKQRKDQKEMLKEQEKLQKEALVRREKWQKEAEEAHKRLQDRQAKKFLDFHNAANAVAWKVVGATAGVIAGVGAGAFKGASGIIDDAKTAADLGLSINDLRGAMVLAGPAAEAMGAGLANMQVLLANARDGSLDATEAIRGLVKLGGVEFKQGGGLTSLAGIAENLANISDPAVRAAQAFRIFGSSAAQLLPILAQGKGGVFAAQEAMQRMGLGVSPGDLASMQQAAKVMSDLQQFGKGLLTQAAVALGPMVAQLKGVLESIDISQLRDGLLTAIESVGLGVTALWAVFSDTTVVRRAWDSMMTYFEASFQRVSAEMSRTLAGVFDAAGAGATAAALKGLAGSYDRLSLTTQNRSIGIAGEALQLLKGSPAVAGFRQWMDGVRGATNAPGAPGLNVPSAQMMEVINKLTAALQSIRTPTETFAQAAKDIAKFQANGLLAGTPNGGARLAFNAFQALQQSVGWQMNRPGAALTGSREAYTSMLNNERFGQRGNVQEQIRQLLDADARRQEEQIRIGIQTLAEMRRRNLPGTANF